MIPRWQVAVLRAMKRDRLTLAIPNYRRCVSCLEARAVHSERCADCVVREARRT